MAISQCDNCKNVEKEDEAEKDCEVCQKIGLTNNDLKFQNSKTWKTKDSVSMIQLQRKINNYHNGSTIIHAT